jgi:hypothetical protein
MQEYEELGHMNQINEDASNPADLNMRHKSGYLEEL